MLILSRKKGGQVIIGGGLVTVTLVEIRGDKVRLGFEAPRELPIHRAEVQRRVDRAGGRRIHHGGEEDSPRSH